MILDKQKKMETQIKGREKTKQLLSIFQKDCFCRSEKISGSTCSLFVFHSCVIIFYIYNKTILKRKKAQTFKIDQLA
jgi:hypothetical protein